MHLSTSARVIKTVPNSTAKLHEETNMKCTHRYNKHPKRARTEFSKGCRQINHRISYLTQSASKRPQRNKTEVLKL